MPDAWIDPDRLRLTDEKTYNSGLPREEWVLDFATGAFSKAEAP